MPQTIAQIRWARSRAPRYRPQGMETGQRTENGSQRSEPKSDLRPQSADLRLLAAKAAVEEIQRALSAAGIFNIGSIESRPQRLQFLYRCPGINCAQHAQARSGERGVRNSEDGGHKPEGRGQKSDGSTDLRPRTSDHRRDCPVLAVLTRLVGAGVLSKVKQHGMTIWSLEVQLCRHGRSGMKVHFEHMKRNA